MATRRETCSAADPCPDREALGSSGDADIEVDEDGTFWLTSCDVTRNGGIIAAIVFCPWCGGQLRVPRRPGE